MGPLTLPPPDPQGIDRVRGGGPPPALLALAVALVLGFILLALLASCGGNSVPNRASASQTQGTAYDVGAIQAAIAACDARGGYSAIYQGAAYCSVRPIGVAGGEER